MKNKIDLIAICLCATSLLAGCCTSDSTNTGKTGESITLEDAMASIGRGFHQMKESEQGLRTGLLPDTVTVTLNVGVSKQTTGSVSGGLSVSAPTPVGANVGANLGGSSSKSQTFQTANTITITFKNIMFAGAPTSTGGGSSASNSLPSLPLLKDPATAKEMLTWIATNTAGSLYMLEISAISNAINSGGTLFLRGGPSNARDLATLLNLTSTNEVKVLLFPGSTNTNYPAPGVPALHE
jgi:hypothetical protein